MEKKPEAQVNEDLKVIQEGKFFAAIGYISILCIASLLLKKENKFATFHAKQGLVLVIFEVAASILRIIPVLGDLIFTLVFVVCGILSLVGIVQVLMNSYWEMPVVGDIAEKISI
jgi:fumarate reductase subunit D